MFEEVWKYLAVFFTSMVKFFPAPLLGVLSGLSVGEVAALCVAGMMVTVTVFVLVGSRLRLWIIKKILFEAEEI